MRNWMHALSPEASLTLTTLALKSRRVSRQQRDFLNDSPAWLLKSLTLTTFGANELACFSPTAQLPHPFTSLVAQTSASRPCSPPSPEPHSLRLEPLGKSSLPKISLAGKPCASSEGLAHSKGAQNSFPLITATDCRPIFPHLSSQPMPITNHHSALQPRIAINIANTDWTSLTHYHSSLPLLLSPPVISVAARPPKPTPRIIRHRQHRRRG